MNHHGDDSRFPNRRLIDLIPDHNLYASDDDDAYYRNDDDDYFVHPKWTAMINRTTNRIPRRIQRYSFVYLGVLVLVLIAWKSHFGPQYAQYRKEWNEMETIPEAAYGSNIRPQFKDMVQVKTLDEEFLPVDNRRLIIIGDVHGCKEELEHLLQKVDFNKKHDHLILTGDIISKGPDSPGVVTLAQDLGASSVRGNHEDKLLLSIAEQEARHAGLPGPDEDADRTTDFLDEESFSHGDYKLRKFAKQFSKKQINWLKQCPVILKVGKLQHMGDVAVVHAGLVPGIPLEQQDPFQCMNMRTIDLKTRIPSEGRDHTHWEKFWNHQQKKLSSHERTTVVYGHDAKRGLNIQKYSFGLDSSCVRGGHLSAMVIDGSGKNKIVQVKCKTDYTAKTEG